MVDIPRPLLKLDRLACSRGERRLFSDLSLEMLPGWALYISGANGAGKTSLLRLLAGLAVPDEGEVQWEGESIRRLREEFSREVFFLGHAAALKDDLTACENLMISSQIAGIAVTEEEARRALQVMGLKGREDLPARVLSQGQRRRVNLARLVLPETPRLWILDEPFNALDVQAVVQLLQVMLAHLNRGGLLVYTTHQEVKLEGHTILHVVIEKKQARLC